MSVVETNRQRMMKMMMTLSMSRRCDETPIADMHEEERVKGIIFMLMILMMMKIVRVIVVNV